jgi:hypothetical protein
MYKFLLGVAGAVLGAALAVFLPFILDPHPGKFDIFFFVPVWICAQPLPFIGLGPGIYIGSGIDRKRKNRPDLLRPISFTASKYSCPDRLIFLVDAGLNG